jgi:hypothetical protein
MQHNICLLPYLSGLGNGEQSNASASLTIFVFNKNGLLANDRLVQLTVWMRFSNLYAIDLLIGEGLI